MAGSPGSYQGVVINPGTDAQISAQLAAIDAKSKTGQASAASAAGPTGPTTSAVPGIGTLTITPKAIQTAPVKDTGGVGDNAAGLYARTGVPAPATPAPAPAGELSYTDALAGLTKSGLSGGALSAAQAALKTHYDSLPSTTGYTAPNVDGLPTYPGSTPATSTPQSAMLAAYNTTLDTISSLEKTIASASVPSDQEQLLTKQLNDAKAKLASFDVGTLQSEENLHGQGRGATLGTIDTRTTILDRTRALERLGFATDASTIATQLQTAQDARTSQGDLAKTEYDLATKRLDIALGVQDKIDSLNDKDQQNARQYLLDVVNFADGKTYDQLDAATQAAITSAVAKSPITLDMVQTALKSGADKAAAAKAGDLRSVAGVGIVQIAPNGTYKVVVPENPATHTSPSASVPSFNDYLSAQNIPLPSLTPTKIAQIQAEYNAKYPAAGTTDVNLGKLSPTNKNDISQAGLSSAPSAVQSYFLNAPAAFRDQYQRDFASGKVKGAATLDALNAAYTAWYNAQKKSTSGSHDWSAILGLPAATSTSQ